MENKEILLRAIEKARSKGWKKDTEIDWDFLAHYYSHNQDFWRMYFLSPEFAKKFWEIGWEKHLQKMVINNNIIKYLEEQI